MTDQVQTERRTDSINLSPVAAAKVKSLLEQEGRDDLSLRISVQPGGCSGLRYQLFFDERSLDSDEITDFDGVSVVVDRMSVPYLNGAMIDFVDSIDKQGFTIDNPNATGSCACGDSFHWADAETTGVEDLGTGPRDGGLGTRGSGRRWAEPASRIVRLPVAASVARREPGRCQRRRKSAKRCLARPRDPVSATRFATVTSTSKPPKLAETQSKCRCSSAASRAAASLTSMSRLARFGAWSS